MLDRGQLVPGPGGRLWMDGAMFDITERREAEEALRRARDRGGPHRGAARVARADRRGRRRGPAQDRARPPRRRPAAARARSALDVRVARARLDERPGVGRRRSSSASARSSREASAELRELARGIHPAVLTERGLAAALEALAARAPVPVEVARRCPTSGCPPWSRRPPTSRSPRRSRTWPSTPSASHADGRGSRSEDGDARRRGQRRRRRRRDHGRRLGPERPRRPRRRDRRHAQRAQPAGRGHDDPGLRAARSGRRAAGKGRPGARTLHSPDAPGADTPHHRAMPTVLLVTDSASGHVVARPARLRERLAARWRARSLERELARGAAPESAAALALRAQALIGPSVRAALARQVRAVLSDARRPVRVGSARVRPRREDVAAAECELDGSPRAWSRPTRSARAASRGSASCSATAAARCTPGAPARPAVGGRASAGGRRGARSGLLVDRHVRGAERRERLARPTRPSGARGASPPGAPSGRARRARRSASRSGSPAIRPSSR